MKNIFKKFINTPWLAIGIALIIAIVVGAASFRFIVRPAAPTAADISATAPVPAPNSTLTLAFTVGGTIKSVAVKVGDSVTAGEVLASVDSENAQGAVTEAQGAYQAAEANYQKVINGATGTAVTVAKDAVTTAQTNLDETTKTQAQLVQNAHDTLLSTGLQAVPADTTSMVTPPTLSGSYTLGAEGTLTITTHQAGTGYFTYSGIISGTGMISTVTPQPIGTSGLYIMFSSAVTQPDWIINIPNTNSSSYLADYNAYQTAIQAQSQALATAQSAVTTAQANLANLQVAARPEDVAAAQAQVESTQGALQIAQSAYTNTMIVAPADGTITNVSITAGQIATPNTPAIELLTK